MVIARGDDPNETAIQGWLGELRWEGSDRIVLQPAPMHGAPIVVDLPPLVA
jgi:hypothetical protein